MIGTDNTAQRTSESVASLGDAVSEERHRGLGYARQERALPLATRGVVVLGAPFLLVTLAQMSYLYWMLGQSVPSDTPTYVHGILDSASHGEFERTQLALAAQLESEAITRRHESVAITQMERLWIRYLGFITGMIMAIIGSTFVLASVRTSGTSKIGAKGWRIQTISRQCFSRLDPHRPRFRDDDMLSLRLIP